MRVIAILASYNEERFIGNCLNHFHQQGVQTYLIDNGSTDCTVAIAEQFRDRGLIGLEHVPRDGVYRWHSLLERKQELAATLPADWFIHVDADEIHLPPRANQTLVEALAEADAAGCNTVNYQEFTFTATRETPDHDHPDYLRTMQHYYAFRLPALPLLLRAWKRTDQPVGLAASGGHEAEFPGRRISAHLFKMRHYSLLSVDHVVRKYVQRVFAKEDLQRGWHGWRAALKADQIRLPAQAELKPYVSDDLLDASQPRTRHFLPVFAGLQKEVA